MMIFWTLTLVCVSGCSADHEWPKPFRTERACRLHGEAIQAVMPGAVTVIKCERRQAV